MTKKINHILIVIMLLFTLTSCTKKDSNDSEIVLPLEKDIVVLEELPYYRYLNETNPVVTINVKEIGTMELELFPNVANNTVNNFITYILDEEFSNSTFHRIIEDFMIQGGIVSNTNDPIRGEFYANGFDNPLSHYRGILSMARTNYVDSATSQFFIMHKHTISLDGNYAAFGGLISGFNVLDYIATVSTNSNDAPLQRIVIESITIDLKDYELKEVNYTR